VADQPLAAILLTLKIDQFNTVTQRADSNFSRVNVAILTERQGKEISQSPSAVSPAIASRFQRECPENFDCITNESRSYPGAEMR